MRPCRTTAPGIASYYFSDIWLIGQSWHKPRRKRWENMQPGATWERYDGKKEKWWRERLVKEGGETEETWKDGHPCRGRITADSIIRAQKTEAELLWPLAEQDRGLREMTSCYLFLSFLTLLLICPHSFISCRVHQAPNGLHPLAVGAHSSGEPESCVLFTQDWSPSAYNTVSFLYKWNIQYGLKRPLTSWAVWPQ